MAKEKPTSESELKFRGLSTKDLITSIKTYGKDKVILHRNLKTVQEYVQERRSNGFKVNIFAPQPGTQEIFLANKASIKCLHGSRGGGKGLSVNDLVLTPSGFKRNGDLKVGDEIINPNGKYQVVTDIFDRGIQDVYEVTLYDGRKCTVDGDHLWLIKKQGYDTGKTSELKKYIDLDFTGRIVNTIELIKELNNEKGKAIYIPRCQAIEFSSQFYSLYKRKFSPYILGVLLGDGSIRGKRINWSKPDTFIRDRIINMGYNVHTCYTKDGSHMYNFCGESLQIIRQSLKEMNLHGCICYDKFIPDCYKFAPIKDRLELLQGLIDTDGSVCKEGKITYSTSSEKLAKDIQWLIWSIGGYCTLSQREPKYRRKTDPKDSEYRIGRTSYMLYIKVDDMGSIVSLPRKKDRIQINPHVERTVRVISCTPKGKERTICIKVSDPNELYLANDFITTHNTFIMGMEALKMADKANYSALVFRKDKTSAEKADGILKVVSAMLEQYGEYLDSKRLSRLDVGGEVRYDYFGDACIGGEGGVQAFFDRQQGANVTKVIIDEAAQAPECVVNYLQTVLRSAAGLKTSMICSMNPNPYSEYWRALVDWWVDDDGMAIPERSGKIRYFFQYGDTIKETAWGNTPEEVFHKAKDHIIERFGRNKKIDETNCHNYIKNITFIASDLEDNKIMLSSNPDYEKNLGGTAQEVSINALGSWKLIKGGNEWITRTEMEDFFTSEPRFDDEFRCTTLDIAYGYGDMIVMGYWIGHHLQDLAYSNTVKPKELYGWVRNNLWEWDIGENRLAFDGLGAPMFRDEFPDSYAILRAVEKDNRKPKGDQPIKIYYDLRSQLADYMVNRLKGVITDDKRCGFSINPDLLDKPYKNTTVREEFLKQRRAILRDVERENGKLRLLQKKDAKKIVGSSPDLIEGTLLYRGYFDVCNVFMPVEEDIFENLKWC